MPLPKGSTPFTDADLKAIGEVVVAGAALESMFDWGIHSLAGTDLPIGLAITSGLRTSGKVNILGVLARLRLDGNELEEFKHALGEAKALMSKRDRLVHGAGWDPSGTEDVVQYHRVRSDGELHFGQIVFEKQDIVQLSTRLGESRTRLYKALGHYRPGVG